MKGIYVDFERLAQKSSDSTILLLLIEDLFWNLHVKPPMILGGHFKKIKKS